MVLMKRYLCHLVWRSCRSLFTWFPYPVTHRVGMDITGTGRGDFAGITIPGVLFLPLLLNRCFYLYIMSCSGYHLLSLLS